MLKKIIKFFKDSMDEYNRMEKIKANMHIVTMPAFIDETEDPVPNLITIEEIKATLRKNNPRFAKRRLLIIPNDFKSRPPFSVTRKLVIDKIMEDLYEPNCPNCKASFNKANDGSVYVEVDRVNL